MHAECWQTCTVTCHAHTWRERSTVAAASMATGTTKKGLHANRYCQYTFLSTLPSARASLCAGAVLVICRHYPLAKLTLDLNLFLIPTHIPLCSNNPGPSPDSNVVYTHSIYFLCRAAGH